ncbi:hypothetical protein [Domibacillus epiphyticus]|nr:hypothetical protein [Domibacillus epiphyticus]
MGEWTYILSNELGRLIDDYYRCTDTNIKEQIQIDIQLLSEAMFIGEQSS